MAQTKDPKIIHTSMRGKVIDLDLLRQKNELTPAVGNAKVNARGDELGPGGKIIRTKEEILKSYYDSHQGMPDETVKSRPLSSTNVKKVTDQETITETVEPDWEEDTEGNFVQKKSRTRSK